MKNINSLVACVCFFLAIGIQPIFSQVIIEGYAFESGNRGFLNEVFVEVYNVDTNELISRTRSTPDGKFELTAPAGKSLVLKGSKDLFHETEMSVSTVGKAAKEKVFVKLELNRAPGYIFDITMAEKREEGDEKVDAIRGALVEVYNNTTREPIKVLDDHPHPDFRIDLEKGNHYTILIRKEGFLAKRMEAFVNVKGCILCFEGVGEVQPGVSDNLTEGNKMGTLLANVELEKLYTGKKITLNNIYYDYGKASIRKDAEEELQNAITFLMDNPRINVELSAHTDSRGLETKNQALSDKRARNTMQWILDNSELSSNRIVSRGYGETKLLNKCGSSSDCTEAEHAINRRTEFKILSIAAAREPFKSLEKMKLEENMDDIIAQLQSEGQVKVTDEADLEKIKSDGLKIESKENKVEELKSAAVNQEESKSGEIEKSELKTGGARALDKEGEGAMHKLDDADKSMSEEAINKIQEVKAAKNTVTEAVESKETLPATTAKKEEVKAIIDKVNEINTRETGEEMVEVSKQNTVTNTAEMKKPDSSLIAENRINTVGNFTGYKYVILFSGTALADDHDIFSKHDDVEVLQTGSDNFLYMIGDYATKVYADSGLSTIKKKYPDAYVIGFEKGKRTK